MTGVGYHQDDPPQPVAAVPERPERVTLSTDLFEQVFTILEQLPYGQVAPVLDAVRRDARPDEST